MEKYSEFWIENTRDLFGGIVYRVDIYEQYEDVSLVKTSTRVFKAPWNLGFVNKRTKRGLTFATYSLTPRKLDIFLDRADFNIVDADVYDQIIRENN